jgi:hypothetical protein
MGRKALKSWAVPAALLLFSGSDALATGDLTCAIDDANLAFTLFASTNRDHGTIVSVAEGSLTLKASPLAKMGREFKVEREHIIQQWFQQRELRIAINVDNDNGSLLLAITGQGNRNQEKYSGRYSLKLSFPDGGTRSVTGRIKGCDAG